MTVIRERGGYLYVTTGDGWIHRHRLDRPPKPERIHLVRTTGHEVVRGVTVTRVYSAAAPYPWPCGRRIPPLLLDE